MTPADEPLPSPAAATCCPLCGAMAVGQRCKLVCPRCHAVVENCNGD